MKGLLTGCSTKFSVTACVIYSNTFALECGIIKQV